MADEVWFNLFGHGVKLSDIIASGALIVAIYAVVTN